jgi:hypothetical protein
MQPYHPLFLSEVDCVRKSKESRYYRLYAQASYPSSTVRLKIERKIRADQGLGTTFSNGLTGGGIATPAA